MATGGKKPHVVVIGGAGGALVAKELGSAPVDVTLIDAKAYFELTPAIPRVIGQRSEDDVRCEFKSFTRRYTDFLPDNAKFICDYCTCVNTTSIKLSSGQTIQFDFLVLALGTRYESPWKWTPQATKDSIQTVEDREEELVQTWKRIRAAKTCLVIGGGIVGVESAADIALSNPNLSVTLVQSNSELMPQNHSDLRHKVSLCCLVSPAFGYSWFLNPL